jgi:hypothetical protein
MSGCDWELFLATGPRALLERAGQISAVPVGPVDTNPVIRCSAAEGDGFDGTWWHAIALIWYWRCGVQALFKLSEAFVQSLDRLRLGTGIVPVPF